MVSSSENNEQDGQDRTRTCSKDRTGFTGQRAFLFVAIKQDINPHYHDTEKTGAIQVLWADFTREGYS